MAVTYGYVKTLDDPDYKLFTVEDLNKLTEIKGFSEGGWVEPNKYPYIGDGPYEYYVPNTKTYIGANTSTVIRTLTYTLTDEEGRTQTVCADVLHDGTIHVDPSAFTMLMKALGYEDDNTYA